MSIDRDDETVAETVFTQTEVAMGDEILARKKADEMGESAMKVWVLHFLFTTLVVGLGMIFNEGRKMVEAGEYSPYEECIKVYVDVTKQYEDDGAIRCCPQSRDLHVVLCNEVFLPGARALSKYPGALLIPLIPIYLRGLELLVYSLATTPVETWRNYASRFALYIVIINFRGFVLYKALNVLQEHLVYTPNDCWYDNLLAEEPSCHGFGFDFSDHTVLYLASILPIPLFEIVHSLLVPLSRNEVSVLLHQIILVGGVVYLYMIVLGEEFRTAANYHTRLEVTVGFLVSLTVQVPLAFLQCSAAWSRPRRLFCGKTPSDES